MTELLGDKVDRLLKSIGADKAARLIERVGKRPCGCQGRKEALNKWHRDILNAYHNDQPRD